MSIEKVIWDGRFSVGVPALDAQHQGIIRLLNRMIDQQDAAVGSEVVSETLDAMVAYAGRHFRYEERLMAGHGYPGLEEHRQRHRSFTLKTVNFCQATMIHLDSVPLQLLDYLREWWVGHILGEDMEYSSFLATAEGNGGGEARRPGVGEGDPLSAATDA